MSASLPSSGPSRAQLGLQTLVRVLAVVTLVVVANVLSFKYYRRVDLTGGNLAPLTERTKSLLLGLPKPAKLILFFPSDHVLFDPINLVALQYQAASRDISVEIVNPYRDQTRATEVSQRYKIGQRESVVIVDYDGRAKVITAEDLADFDRSPEMVGQAAQPTNLKGEQAITGALLELLEVRRGVIYFVRGQGEVELGAKSPFSVLAMLIERENVVLKELALANVEAVPRDAVAVVVAGARYDLSDKEFKVLRDYWDQQGKCLVLLDPTAQTPQLHGWLGSLGIMVQDDRIYANLGGVTGIIADVPTEFVGDSAIARKFRGVNPQFVGGTQSLRLEPERVAPARIRVSPVLQAVNGFWGEVDWRQAGINGVEFNPEKDRNKDLVVAAMVEKGEAGAPDNSRLIAVSNLKYVLDENLTRQCADFTIAAVNWLLRREALVGIPPRDLRMFTLSISHAQLTQLFVVVVILLPALAAALGGFVWWRRRV
jgi:hypothetical protein